MKPLRYLLLTVVGVLVLILSFSAWFYISCPVYTFEEPKPFSGKNLYNPYRDIDVDAWRKCIFHLHTQSWMGLTNGDHTFEEVLDTYHKLRYDVVGISDYMSINRKNSDDPLYIPAYEHGYNVKKVHQLALGATKVVWRDYQFLQNLSHKQHIIHELKKHSRRVVVNHPCRGNSFSVEDFKYLSGYDLFELQNGTCLSETLWDAALSSGHAMWLVANDDAHSIRPRDIHKEITFINASSPTLSGDEILERLAQGAAFGVHIPRKYPVTFEEKEQETEIISFPESIHVHEDTLYVVWQQTMLYIDFFGDNGTLLKTVTDSHAAFYPIRPDDSYIRVKLISPEGFVYFLNPVVRCAGDEPAVQSLSSIDRKRTLSKRSNYMLLFGMLLTIIYSIVKYLRKSRREKSV